MYRVALFIITIFFFASCENTQSESDADEMEEMTEESATDMEEEQDMEWTNENVSMEFSCSPMEGSEEQTLSLLMQQFDQNIPVDTTSMCEQLGIADAPQYDTPDYVKALASTEEYVYYSYIDKNQVVIMRSPKGSDQMNYEVHMSIPLEAPVNQPQ